MNPYTLPEEPARILIVDDQTPQRGLECDILRESNFVTLEAGSGQEALTLLKQQTVEMVLLRINLPDINGIELCYRIRNHLKLLRVPVLLVTENRASVDLARAFELGATDFISKPFRPIELLIRVRSAIVQKQLVDRLARSESVRLFEIVQIDLVLTDIVMPDRDGFELIKTLKGKVPIIAMTGQSHGDVYLKTARLMGAATLSKPFRNGVVLETVSKIFEEKGH